MGETKTVKVKFSTAICIILIILLAIGCGLLYYLGFVQKDKQIEKIEADKKQVETKNAELEKQIIVVEKEVQNKEKEVAKTTKLNDIPSTDLVKLYCEANDDHAYLFYAYIKDGKLYYYKHFDSADGDKEGTYYDFSTHFYLNEAENEMKIYNGLDNIKRIKMYNNGTGVYPYIYVITDDGKVYSGSFIEHDLELK